YGSNNLNSSSFTTEIYSAYQDYSYNYFSQYIGTLEGCSENSPVQKRCLYVDREKGKPGEYLGHGYCFFINYRKGESKSTSSGGGLYDCPDNKIIFEDILESYQLGDFTFGKTIKIHET